MVCKYFLPLHVLLSHSINCFLCCPEVDVVPLVYFSLSCFKCLFQDIIAMLCSDRCFEAFSLYFLLGILYFQVLHLSCQSIFQLVFVYGIRYKGFYSFTIEYSVFLSFAEEIIFSPFCSLGTFVEYNLTKCVSLCFWALHSVAFVYMSVCMPVPRS